MKINLFEGSRRLAKAIAAILTVGFVIYAIDHWEKSGAIPLFALAAILFLLWALTKTVGWIMRGFFGISEGMDYSLHKMDGERIDPGEL